ncbi:MAG TPA: HEAT repeat domain-containing protein [Vicinamibacterales bacterium]|nr:HEAT repeat domain-containing protein [Vicinamibacterales bacterium]
MQKLVISGVAAFALYGSAAAAQMPFEDVVRNLRNPDAKVRMSALRVLRETKYPEAIQPIAPLVNDPVDDIQLEAIATELAFFLVEEVPDKKRVAWIIEVRNAGRAPAAFAAGPLAVWPREAPPELISALLRAVDDENAKVRLEAIFAVGIVGRPPLADDAAQQLVKALDHYDPAVRAGAARVIGRLQVKSAGDSLIKAINDSNAQVRFASIRALGELREERAVQALTDQFTYYGKGEGAVAALDALARIAHASSVPLFKAHLAQRDPSLRRAAAEGLGRSGDSSEISALEVGAGNDDSEMVRAAMAFALQKLGRNYVSRLVDMMDSSRMAPQIQGYLLELGPSVVQRLVPHLQEPEPEVRARIAEVLGMFGGDAALKALEPLAQDSDREVVAAATRAMERIKMSRG